MNHIESVSEHDARDEERRETMERLQAGEQVDKLEAEIVDLEVKMLQECNGCHPGYVRCKDHADIALEIADRKKIIKEIDQHYGK